LLLPFSLDSYQQLPLTLALGAARTLPLAWLVPAIGGPRVAASMRVGLGVLLAVLCLPALVPAARGSALLGAGPIGWILVAAREALVGLSVGLCAGVLFRAAEAAGRLADIARGANLAEVLSPLSDERSSPLGDLYLFTAVVIFLELGGLRIFAGALQRSYEAVPIGVTTSTLSSLRPAAELVTASVGKLLESAIGLAAPVLVALWLADAVLGLLGRASPQVPIYFAAMPGKALLGLGVVLLGLGAVDAALVAGFSGWSGLLERAFGIWRGV
jgi:type III secretory pathway component EscT